MIVVIKGILTFQFELNQSKAGDIEPNFSPIQLAFTDKNFTVKNYKDLLTENDTFSIFYQHTAGSVETHSKYLDIYLGRLKETPYQVISFFKPIGDISHFLAISIFEFDDELEIFKETIENMTNKLDSLFNDLIRARNSRKMSLITNVNKQILNEIKFAIFHVERLTDLDKLQKIGLIYKSKERIEILNLLREYPRSRIELKKELRKKFPGINLDVMLEPFINLNLVRRDWIKGEVNRKD